MAPAVLLAITIAMAAAQAAMSIKANNDRNKEIGKAAKLRNDELLRQNQRGDLIAQEEKSDAAREADFRMGTMLANAADSGASATATYRMGGEIGGVEGLDIARIESNRREGQYARRYEGLTALSRDKAEIKSNRLKNTGAVINFVKTSASSAYGYASGPSVPTTTSPSLSYGAGTGAE